MPPKLSRRSSRASSFLSSSRLQLQVLSDLHLERSDSYDFEFEVTAPVLLLSGNIGRLQDYDRLKAFLVRQCQRYEKVLYVLGSEEFYGSAFHGALKTAERLEDDSEMSGKLVVLHRKRHDLDYRVTVLGCTLRSHITDGARAEVQSQVQDFREIQDWNIDAHNEQHLLDVAFLQDSIVSIAKDEPHRLIVVATSYPPVLEGTLDPTNAQQMGPCASAHATDLLQPKVTTWYGFTNIDTWVFGHTLITTEFRFKQTRIFSNQRGSTIHGIPAHDTDEDSSADESSSAGRLTPTRAKSATTSLLHSLKSKLMRSGERSFDPGAVLVV